MADGTAAHALLAGQKPPKLSPRARSFYERLQFMYAEMDYTPLWLDEEGKPVVELRQVVPLSKSIKLVRVIDAFAKTKDGEAVLIDYKTTVWPWRLLFESKSATNPVPQSMGFQATAYLIPPNEPTPFAWPNRIDFLVASERGGLAVHTYRQSPEDMANLLDAIQVVHKAKLFPKHSGNGCAFCSYKEACFGTPGWEALYEKKGK